MKLIFLREPDRLTAGVCIDREGENANNKHHYYITITPTPTQNPEDKHKNYHSKLPTLHKQQGPPNKL
jgi:hypothetical protein